MKVNFYFVNPTINTAFLWQPYKHIKGVNIRIFGFHINIRESDATEKLIKIAQLQARL